MKIEVFSGFILASFLHSHKFCDSLYGEKQQIGTFIQQNTVKEIKSLQSLEYLLERDKLRLMFQKFMNHVIQSRKIDNDEFCSFILGSMPSCIAVTSVATTNQNGVLLQSSRSNSVTVTQKMKCASIDLEFLQDVNIYCSAIDKNVDIGAILWSQRTYQDLNDVFILKLLNVSLKIRVVQGKSSIQGISFFQQNENPLEIMSIVTNQAVSKLQFDQLIRFYIIFQNIRKVPGFRFNQAINWATNQQMQLIRELKQKRLNQRISLNVSNYLTFRQLDILFQHKMDDLQVQISNLNFLDNILYFCSDVIWEGDITQMAQIVISRNLIVLLQSLIGIICKISMMPIKIQMSYNFEDNLFNLSFVSPATKQFNTRGNIYFDMLNHYFSLLKLGTMNPEFHFPILSYSDIKVKQRLKIEVYTNQKKLEVRSLLGVLQIIEDDSSNLVIHETESYIEGLIFGIIRQKQLKSKVITPLWITTLFQ